MGPEGKVGGAMNVDFTFAQYTGFFSLDPGRCIIRTQGYILARQKYSRCGMEPVRGVAWKRVVQSGENSRSQTEFSMGYI